MAPKVAISIAPLETSIVPPNDHRVKGSPSITVAHIELKTSPEACRVDKTGRGSVVICIVLPTRFDIMNMPMPSCHRRRLYGGLRSSYGPFSSSRRCDFRCRVKPKLWTLVDIRPTSIPICKFGRSVSVVERVWEQGHLRLHFLLAKGRRGFPSRKDSVARTHWRCCSSRSGFGNVKYGDTMVGCWRVAVGCHESLLTAWNGLDWTWST